MTATAISTDLRSRALLLLWLTIAWNVIEGIIAVASGAAAGSVALIGFGLDSFIEVGAAGIVIWGFTIPAHDPRFESREVLARRVVGVTFLILATYILGESIYVVVTGSEPETSQAGIMLALASLAVMPILGLLKRRNARLLGSGALMAESTETLICCYLSVTLFIGLAANAAFGWWWADIAAALAMVPWIAKEGLEAIRGESCEEECA